MPQDATLKPYQGSPGEDWFACSRELRANGFNHTAGNSFAKLEGRKITQRATIWLDANDAPCIVYGEKAA